MELRAVGSVALPPPRGQSGALIAQEAAPLDPEESFARGLAAPGPKTPPSSPKSYLIGAVSLTMVAVAGALAVPGFVWGTPTQTREEPVPSAPPAIPMDPSLEDWNIAGAPVTSGPGGTSAQASGQVSDGVLSGRVVGEGLPGRVSEHGLAGAIPGFERAGRNGSSPGSPARSAVESEPPERPYTRPKELVLPPAQKGDFVRHRINFSNMISDQDFTDSSAANADDLQFFLEKKGSFLAVYTEDGRTAAQIVAQAATEHRINPWVVLASLEKEASLVSRQRKPRDAKLRAAMGYAYNDSGSTAGKHSTFGYQVDRGTALLRELYDEGKAQEFPRTLRVNYGKRKLTIRNAATYALMRYTPHTTDTALRRTGGGNYLLERSLVRFEREYARFYAEAATGGVSR